MVTQILFSMCDLGIQKFKHFSKARIVSDGVPPFRKYETVNQLLVAVQYRVLQRSTGIFPVAQIEITLRQVGSVYEVYAINFDYS